MNTNSDTPQPLYLGLDVHKAETVIAILESDRDAEPRQYGSIGTTQHALERAMRRIAKKQGRRLSDLHVCYEASGCGFWIARRLLQMGVYCDVIVPSLIPTKSGDRLKTDKRDAAKLAKALRSNDLVAVNIPDSTDEAIRDLCRARTDAHKRYLRELKLPSPVLHLVMENNLGVIDEALERVANLEKAMTDLNGT